MIKIGRCIAIIFSAALLVINIQLLSAAEDTEEKTWWESRQERPDIYYPHKVHMSVMNKKGDSCMLCHAFSATQAHDIEQVQAVTKIANEPLEAICHDCHVSRLDAPWRCDLCHSDPKAVWPESHQFGYVSGHAEDAIEDENACKSCHVDTTFCTNCHFRRDPVERSIHSLGYRNYHGIEARLDPAWCSSCHGGQWCENCHRGR